MTDIPKFNNVNDEEIYQTIFSEKLNDYYMLMSSVRARFFPNYNWDNLNAETLSVLRDITTMLIYNTTQEFSREVPGYELDRAVLSDIDL